MSKHRPAALQHRLDDIVLCVTARYIDSGRSSTAEVIAMILGVSTGTVNRAFRAASYSVRGLSYRDTERGRMWLPTMEHLRKIIIATRKQLAEATPLNPGEVCHNAGIVGRVWGNHL